MSVQKSKWSWTNSLCGIFPSSFLLISFWSVGMHGMKVAMPVWKHRNFQTQKYSQIHFTTLTKPKSLLFKCSTTLRVFLKHEFLLEKACRGPDATHLFSIKTLCLKWSHQELKMSRRCMRLRLCAKEGDLFPVAPSSPLSFFCLSCIRHQTLK